MVAKLIAASIIAVLAWSVAPASAELWQCGESAYTNRREHAESCTPLEISRVCGSGQNRFITKFKAGMRPEYDACERGAEPRSPFVHTADLQAVSDSSAESKIRNWERKLMPTLARAPDLHAGVKDDFNQELGELKSYLEMIPGGQQVLKTLGDETQHQ